MEVLLLVCIIAISLFAAWFVLAPVVGPVLSGVFTMF